MMPRSHLPFTQFSPMVTSWKWRIQYHSQEISIDPSISFHFYLPSFACAYVCVYVLLYVILSHVHVDGNHHHSQAPSPQTPSWCPFNNHTHLPPVPPAQLLETINVVFIYNILYILVFSKMLYKWNHLVCNLGGFFFFSRKFSMLQAIRKKR